MLVAVAASLSISTMGVCWNGLRAYASFCSASICLSYSAHIERISSSFSSLLTGRGGGVFSFDCLGGNGGGGGLDEFGAKTGSARLVDIFVVQFLMRLGGIGGGL